MDFDPQVPLNAQDAERAPGDNMTDEERIKELEQRLAQTEAELQSFRYAQGQKPGNSEGQELYGYPDRAASPTEEKTPHNGQTPAHQNVENLKAAAFEREEELRMVDQSLSEANPRLVEANRKLEQSNHELRVRNEQLAETNLQLLQENHALKEENRQAEKALQQSKKKKTQTNSENMHIEQELTASHQELEQHVQQRTQELKTANDELRIEIEERQRAEAMLSKTNQALRESESLLRQVLELLPVGVWIVDQDGRITFGNLTGSTIWGGARYVGMQQYGEYKAWWLDTGKPIATEDWAAARAISRGETSIGEEIRIETFDGSQKIILNSALPLRGRQGEIRGAIIVNQDITARRQAEALLKARSDDLAASNRALAESEARLRTVVDNAPLVLFTINAQGTYTLLEGSALASIGLKPGELVGRSIFERIIGREELLGYIRRALSGEEVTFTTRSIGPAEEFFEVHYVPYFDLSGQVEGVVGVSINITDRYRAEAALQQANQELEARVAQRTAELTARTVELQEKGTALEISNQMLEETKLDLEYELAERERAESILEQYTLQLERSNRDLQDFASIASHDLQEPLRKIQAFGDRLRQKSKAKLDEDERDYLERMIRGAANMSRMIHDLLAYSRLSTRSHPDQPVDLGKSANEALADLEIQIEQTGGQVSIDPLPVIEADPLQMRQLFLNLIGNALKFHKPGLAPVVKVYVPGTTGEQGLRTSDQGSGTRNESIKSSHQSLVTNPQPLVTILIEDNGIGFDPQYAERIFQPFQRLHGRSQYEGTGIGLAVCRKIVERHQGSLTATSVPGQGSKFLINLPYRQSRGETNHGL